MERPSTDAAFRAARYATLDDNPALELCKLLNGPRLSKPGALRSHGRRWTDYRRGGWSGSQLARVACCDAKMLALHAKERKLAKSVGEPYLRQPYQGCPQPHET